MGINELGVAINLETTMSGGLGIQGAVTTDEETKLTGDLDVAGNYEVFRCELHYL